MRTAVLKGNSGQALMLVLTAVSLLLVLTGSLGLITRLTKENVIGEQQFIRAVYAADSGIEKTAASILTEAPAGPQWYTGLSGSEYTGILSGSLPGNNRFEVKAQKGDALSIGTMLLLQSVGECLDESGKVQAKKTVKADMAVFTAADFFRGLSILPEAPLLFDNTGNMPVVVDGDFLLNGSLNTGESLQVNGPVYASGPVTGSYPQGKYDGCPYIPPFPNPDSLLYEDRAASDGQVFNAGAVFTNPPDGTAKYNGYYYIDGDLDISGDFTGSAVFFATGDITIYGELTPRLSSEDVPDPTAGDLTLIALEDIELYNCTVYASLMARGLEVRGNVVLYGAACTTAIDFQPETPESGNFTIHSGGAPLPDQEAIPAAIKILKWQELYPVF